MRKAPACAAASHAAGVLCEHAAGTFGDLGKPGYPRRLGRGAGGGGGGVEERKGPCPKVREGRRPPERLLRGGGASLGCGLKGAGFSRAVQPRRFAMGNLELESPARRGVKRF